MRSKRIIRTMVGVSAVAALFAAFAVQAQAPQTGGTQAGNTQPGTQAGGTQGGTPASSQGNTASGGGASGKLDKADQKIVMHLAQANMAEIEEARLAQSKSQNDQVKNFAKQMIDDHTKALDEVKALAANRGVTLPTDLDKTHKAKADKLGNLSGDAFDRAYLKDAGVADHKKAQSMLRQAQGKARDPDVKALVARILPTVEQHLNSVQQLQKGSGKNGKAATTS
jgi:putative membrane protein